MKIESIQGTCDFPSTWLTYRYVFGSTAGNAPAARTVRSGPLCGQSDLLVLQCRTSCREPGDRDAERRAGHVREACAVEEVDRIRIATVLATDTGLQTGLGLAALLDAHGDELADALLVERLEGVLLDDLVVDVRAEEAELGVVTRDADAGLGEVVRAEREEVGLVRDLIGDECRARDLDHGADRVPVSYTH